MPELPEVETIRRGLEKFLVGREISDVEVKNKRIFSGNPKDIIGAKILEVRRFGKGLVIDLDNDCSLAIHIKLTGQFIFVDSQGTKETNGSQVSKEKVGLVPNKFTHVIFQLGSRKIHPDGVYTATFQEDLPHLYYNDIRQFGWIKVIKTDQLNDLQFFKELGPEFPLVDDSGQVRLIEEKFIEILAKSKLAIKPLIMDQKKMAGVGNIYASDALWLAKIDPRRPANSLADKEKKDLYEAILTVLKKGLEQGGASELTFVNALGQIGNYQNYMLIYGKQGQECSRCGTRVIKYMLGGRGTCVCPTCQK